MNMIYHKASYFKNHYNAIKEIAFSSKVLVDNEILSHDTLPFKTYMHIHWITFPAQTQIVETGVKDAALCTSTGRLEETRTVLDVIRSKTVHNSNNKAAKEKDDIGYIKANQYIKAGKRGLRKRKGINEEMINKSDGKTVRR